MSNLCSLASLRSRIEQVQQDDELYFAGLLDQQTIAAAFGPAGSILDNAKIYTTAVTLWVVLSQVLSTNHGCVWAVTRLIAYRTARGLKRCNADTAAYCIARDKLDEQALADLVRHTGCSIEEKAPGQWLWLGHRVVIYLVPFGAAGLLSETDIEQPVDFEPQLYVPEQKSRGVPLSVAG